MEELRRKKGTSLRLGWWLLRLAPEFFRLKFLTARIDIQGAILTSQKLWVRYFTYQDRGISSTTGTVEM